MSEAGFIVLETRQTGGYPYAASDLCDDLAWAQAEASRLTEEARAVGRGDSYRVCRVVELSDEEGDEARQLAHRLDMEAS